MTKPRSAQVSLDQTPYYHVQKGHPLLLPTFIHFTFIYFYLPTFIYLP